MKLSDFLETFLSLNQDDLNGPFRVKFYSEPSFFRFEIFNMDIGVFTKESSVYKSKIYFWWIESELDEERQEIIDDVYSAINLCKGMKVFKEEILK